jgi:hypothetical protein
MSLNKKIEEVSKEDLESLVNNKVSESKMLDYKEAYKVSNDKDRKEFLADICSFANSGGGHIIYGVSEELDDGKNTGLPSEIVGLDSFNSDTEIRRLDESIRNGIEPLIQGVKFHTVENFPKGPVFIIEIPASLSKPHMVTFKGSSRFYGRSSASKYQMEVSEIRESFLQAEALEEKINSFRLDRLISIKNNETPFPIKNVPQLVLHIFSLSSFSKDKTVIDVTNLKNSNISLQPMGASGWNHRINYDGFCTYTKYSYDNEHEPANTYTQLYRNGRIEAVDSYMFSDDNKMIPSVSYEQDLLTFSEKYIDVLESLGVPGPFYVSISLLGVKGFDMAVRRGSYRMEKHLIDKEDLILPSIMIENSDENFFEKLQPAFDLVWNACGYKRSFNYDDNGKWIASRF